MKENILIKKLDSETKNRLVSILNSKTLDSDEIREEFEIEITNYIDDNDLEDLGIYSEDLDYDYLIIHFMQFLPKRKLHESKLHRRRLNENVSTIDKLFRVLTQIIKDNKGNKSLIKFAKTPKNMTMPIKWNAGNNDGGWIDLSNLQNHIEEL